MSTRGFFITIEGGEGVGKSTNIAFLRDVLEKYNVDIVTTREPGGTPLGEEIRDVLLRARPEPIDPMAELLLIFAARAQHIHDVIEPALNSGKWVLCDRFTDATYAYQCGGRGIPSEAVAKLEKLVLDQLRPDYTLLLDVPVTVGMARASMRGDLDRFEQESQEFFERVRSCYLKLATAGGRRYHIIEVGRQLAEVQKDILVFADTLLSDWTRRNLAL